MATSEENPLPTLGEKIRPTRTNARESKEVNSKNIRISCKSNEYGEK